MNTDEARNSSANRLDYGLGFSSEGLEDCHLSGIHDKQE
jgi:hypothetical protein